MEIILIAGCFKKNAFILLSKKILVPVQLNFTQDKKKIEQYLLIKNKKKKLL